MADRPGFTHQNERHGLVGPFSGRQLALAGLAVLAVVIVLVGITTPLGNTARPPALENPRATAFIIGEPPAVGLQAGALAPELAVPLADGSTYQLTDLNGEPVRLEDLRGKVVWLNFWASWCPPCQQETPILRELSERYRSRGLEIVGVSVQETSPGDVGAYAARYQLPYTIAFDGSGHILRKYKVFALPTQVFIDTEGRINTIIGGPVDEVGASALIESMLPGGGAGSPGGGAGSPGGSTPAASPSPSPSPSS